MAGKKRTIDGLPVADARIDLAFQVTLTDVKTSKRLS